MHCIIWMGKVWTKWQNMKFCSEQLLLYAITDRRWSTRQTFLAHVEKSLIGGATCLQLREKNLDRDTFLDEAIKIRPLCKKYNVPFIINDDVDIAIEADADGVHVGQDDMNLCDVRKKLENDKIVGVSVQTVEQAMLATKGGADYLGVGAIFETSTKQDAKLVDINVLKEICQSTWLPVVAIGGINHQTVPILRGSGIRGIAVISAIFAQDDIVASTKVLKTLAQTII